MNKCTLQDCISLAQVFVGESCSNGHDSLLSPYAPDPNPLMELIQGFLLHDLMFCEEVMLLVPLRLRVS